MQKLLFIYHKKKITEAEVSINGVCGTICEAEDELTTVVGVLKKEI